jgi:hypothetical protein
MQAAVIKRDGWCMFCGRIDDTLVAHHIESWGSSGKDTPDNMITLCGRCHNNVGNGYLDIRHCNCKEYLPESALLSGVNAASGSWKIYEPNELLKRVLEGEYGDGGEV